LKLPDFPWDTLAPFGARAREHELGGIDLSQGTPVDATPEFIQQALQENSDSPGYPLTAGTPELRNAIENYGRTRLGVSGEFSVLPSIGSKEMVALLPALLEAKRVLIPRVAYPTYLVSGIFGGAEVMEVEIDPANWPTDVDLVWINNPSNPTGRVHSREELDAVVEWSRKNSVVIASDECYLPFPDTREADSILKRANGNNSNLLALHSLSKRSNLAGYRAAFIAGDSNLIARLLEVRKHLGLMVPLPVQRAMTVALQDEEHVLKQAERYRNRRHKLAPVLTAIGFQIAHSEAGLYIWCTRNERDWDSVAWFAERGILVTPGSFYGSDGANFIRIALTATDAQIEEVARRINQ
jgi:succinyldiaminopimelate transaminase